MAYQPKPLDLSNLPDVASRFLLVTISISLYSGSFTNSKKAEDIAHDAGARSRAAVKVMENLFADCDPLQKLKALSGRIRQWFYRYTLPFADNGTRMVDTATYMNVINSEWAGFEHEWDTLVNAFLTNYNTEISKQAFARGSMFDRSQYPSEGELRRKFALNMSTYPFPSAGHYTAQVEQEVLEEIKARTEKNILENVRAATSEPWERIKTEVERIHERMTAVIEHGENPNPVEEVKTYNDDGTLKSVDIKTKRRPKLHESMLDDGLELCELLKTMNVLNDPALEEARAKLQSALVRVDMDSLKKSKEMQVSTRAAMQDIMDKFL